MRKDRGGHEGRQGREISGGVPATLRRAGAQQVSACLGGIAAPTPNLPPCPKSSPLPQICPLAPNLPPSIHTGWDTELPGRALFGVKTPTLGTLTNPMQLPFHFWGSPAPTGDRGCQEAAP